VLNPKINFGIADESAYMTIDPRTEREKYSFSIASFLDSISIPITKYASLPKSTTEYKKDGSIIYQISPPAKRFCVFGEINYRTENLKDNTLRFKTLVWIGTQIQRYGAGMNITSEYCLFLEAGKGGITKHIPISQFLKSGDVDHFAVLVATDKSSLYDLSFDFITADGKVLKTKHMIIDIFVPRLQNKYHFRSIKGN